MALINNPRTVMMIDHYFSFTIAGSVVCWHQIPGVVYIHYSARAGVLLLKGEMCCAVLPIGPSIIQQHPTSIPGTYSEMGLISSLETIKYDFPYLFFLSHPGHCRT